MEFRNLTPFPALAYSALDKSDEEHHVLVMRMTYRLVRESATSRHAVMVMDEEPPALCMADEYFGEMNQSSVKQESDLAPCKPRCDVIINGSAHAPRGEAQRTWTVHVRIQAAEQPSPLPEPPRPLNPFMPLTALQEAAWQAEIEHAKKSSIPGKVFLDKTLRITGPRHFKKKFWGTRFFQQGLKWMSLGLIRMSPWKLTTPPKIVSLPLRYEHAFGGQCRIDATDRAARRVPPKYRLTAQQKAQHPDRDVPPAAHTIWPANPLGCGWSEQWYLRASGIKQLPAPQIEYADVPVTAKLFWKSALGKIPPDHPVLRPGGFGYIGRPWSPRLPLAGTYDEQWLQERHPYLPEDFDFRYWNGAPADQQTDYLPPDVRIHLGGLHPDGDIDFQLPGHRAFALVRYDSGQMLPLPLLIDTLIIDTDAMTLTTIGRISLHKSPAIRILEARYETDPGAPLMRLAEEETQEVEHG